jgi:hypothetical protein
MSGLELPAVTPSDVADRAAPTAAMTHANVFTAKFFDSNLKNGNHAPPLFPVLQYGINTLSSYHPNQADPSVGRQFARVWRGVHDAKISAVLRLKE